MGREVSGRLLLCTWSGRIGSGRVGSPVEPRSSRGWVTTRVGSPVGSKSSRGWVGSGRVEDHQSDHHGDPTGDPRGSSRSPVGSPIGLFLFQDPKNSRDVTRANRSFARTKTNHSPCRSSSSSTITMPTWAVCLHVPKRSPPKPTTTKTVGFHAQTVPTDHQDDQQPTIRSAPSAPTNQ